MRRFRAFLSAQISFEPNRTELNWTIIISLLAFTLDLSQSLSGSVYLSVSLSLCLSLPACLSVRLSLFLKNQRTKTYLIGVRKTPRELDNKDPNRQRQLSPGMRVSTRYKNSTKDMSLFFLSIRLHQKPVYGQVNGQSSHTDPSSNAKKVSK